MIGFHRNRRRGVTPEQSRIQSRDTRTATTCASHRGWGAAVAEDFLETFFPQRRLAEQIFREDVIGARGLQLGYGVVGLLLREQDDGCLGAAQLAAHLAAQV